jgi:hypothetical protein
MPSDVTDEPPGRITADANAEQMDADDELPPSPLTLPAATNAKEAQDNDAAGAAVDVCCRANVEQTDADEPLALSRQMQMVSRC